MAGRIFSASCGILLLLIAGCGTYHDPSDNYVRGVRFFDRGDYATAAELWRPMAAAGDCDAQARYAHLLWLGLDVPADKETAYRYFREAAEGGQAKAQIAMGNLSWNGRSNIYICRGEACPSDAAAAYRWYLLAERHAMYQPERNAARTMADEARAGLDAAAQAKVEDEARNWSPSNASCQPRKLL